MRRCAMVTSRISVVAAANDLGCVKTPKSNLRIEASSRLRQFKEQQRWRPLSGVDNRENNSARSSCAHLFTQPRPKADIACGADGLYRNPLYRLASPPLLVTANVRVTTVPRGAVEPPT